MIEDKLIAVISALSQFGDDDDPMIRRALECVREALNAYRAERCASSADAAEMDRLKETVAAAAGQISAYQWILSNLLTEDGFQPLK